MIKDGKIIMGLAEKGRCTISQESGLAQWICVGFFVFLEDKYGHQQTCKGKLNKGECSCGVGQAGGGRKWWGEIKIRESVVKDVGRLAMRRQ